MNDLGQIYERLRANYGDCDVIYESGQLTVKLETGEIQTDGYGIRFLEEGKETRQIPNGDTDDLYEMIEAFILYQRAGGASAAQPEEVKQERNALYQSAVTESGKAVQKVLLLSGVGETLVLVTGLFLGSGLWLVLLILAWTLLTFVLVGFVCKKSIARYWLCPHCGKLLPTEGTWFAPRIHYVSSCPGCHVVLEKDFLNTDHTVVRETAHRAEKQDFPKPGSRLPGIVIGSLLVFYAVAAILMTLLFIGEISTVNLVAGILLHLPVLALGIALFCCHAPEREYRGVAVVVREAAVVWLIVLFCVAMGLAFVFFAWCLFSTAPIDGFGIFCAAAGIPLVFVGVWAFLAKRNRALLVYENGAMTYVTSWGRRKDFLPGQTMAVCMTANETIQFLDAEGKRLFSVEKNMRGIDRLAEWIEEQNIPTELTEQMQRQMERQEGIVRPVQWREEYATHWHRHLKAIRVGLVLVTGIFLAGAVFPFVFYLQGALKFRMAVYLAAGAALPITVYYLVFAPVFTLNDRPKGATEEWRAMHIRIPVVLLWLPALWLMMLFHYGFDQFLYTVVDDTVFFILWFGIAALLWALCFWRTPKRLRGEGMVALCIFFLAMGYPMAYGTNLLLSPGAEHEPADVVERGVEEDEDTGEPEYFFVVRLEDGTEVKLSVTETEYKKGEAGEEFVVCQFESVFGIRMTGLHITEK